VSEFASWKAEARRAAHDTFAVAATYQDASLPEPVALRVRWHNKVANVTGNGDYATMIETAERIVFDRDELAEKGVSPVRGGVVTLTAYARGDVSPAVWLDTREPYDGQINETWNVARDL
jgi:hypothetical protein